MSARLWQPSPEMVKASQMDRFRRFVNRRQHSHLRNYQDLYHWSVTRVEDFWAALWEYLDVIHSRPGDKVVDDIRKMPGAKWFPGARLNYAENLLRYRDEHPALIFKGESRPCQTLTYGQLYQQVERLAAALRAAGVGPGDRVAGFTPNLPGAVIAMLASASLGAIWSSSSPDFGIKGVLDRFSQIKPKILFAVDGYSYAGKTFNTLKKLAGILHELPSVEQVVVTPHISRHPDLSAIPNCRRFSDFVATGPAAALEFEQLPFDHPLYIMYSSGTTGLPKSIVHGAGGTLLQHLKELRLHTDLRREDRIIYYTTCGWMMWNWLVSSLAVGATVVLYDGSPFHPDGNALWKLSADLGITVFGTSARYIAGCEAAGVRPARDFNLENLRAILSTGSPLSPESFDYVYREIKSDVLLSSISGGTDIISCFVLGNPTLPVIRGEIQCRGLGMDVAAYDAGGKPVINTTGELVCRRPFPSMPVYFWNDPQGEKYRQAYFETYPGVWHHGDYIIISEQGGVTILGRSDATLNPGGVRIGTAEIYRVLDQLPGIDDSLVVGQRWQNDERIILFVKLREEVYLDERLAAAIETALRNQCSPRHVPAKIIPIADIPYTINGKKVEIAVREIIHGGKAANRDALANPGALDLYRDLPELRS